jgi:hypothetical protein
MAKMSFFTLMCIFVISTHWVNVANAGGFSSAVYTVNEGKTLSVTVSRNAPYTSSLNITYKTILMSGNPNITTGYTASTADFTPISGMLSWQAGDNSSKLLSITTKNDLLNEAPETFALELNGTTTGGQWLMKTGVVIINEPLSGKNLLFESIALGVSFLFFGFVSGYVCNHYNEPAEEFEGMHNFYLKKLAAKVKKYLNEAAANDASAASVQNKICEVLDQAVILAGGDNADESKVVPSEVSNSESEVEMIVLKEESISIDLASGNIEWDTNSAVKVEDKEEAPIVEEKIVSEKEELELLIDFEKGLVTF